MSHNAVRMTLTALVLAVAAAFPAAASANLATTVTLNQSAGTTAGSTPSTGVDITFNATAGDEVKDVSLDFPPGSLFNEEIAGGACLGTATPVSACQVGSGTVVISGVATPAALYLVQAPATATADVAGVELVAGTFSTVGNLTFRSSQNIGITPAYGVGAELAFNALPAATPISAMDLTFTDLRLPAACPSPATDISVWSDSQAQTFPHAARAPFVVSDCGAETYSPALTASIARATRSAQADLTLNVLDPVGDSTNQTISITLPSSLTLNSKLDPCLEGSTCTIGTITGVSPVLPTSQLTGTITLSGTVRAPNLTIAFPAPLGLKLASTFNGSSLAIHDMPDIPITLLSLNLTGNALGRPFIDQCIPKIDTVAKVTFSPRSGGPNVIDGNVVTPTSGCNDYGSGSKTAKAGRPTASATLSGVRSDESRLVLTTARGTDAPSIKSVSVTLPKGLGFSSHAVKRSVRSSMTVDDATVKTATLVRGVLHLTFTKAIARNSMSITRPLLTESAALRSAARAGKVKTVRVVVGLTDASGRSTTLKLTVKIAS